MLAETKRLPRLIRDLPSEPLTNIGEEVEVMRAVGAELERDGQLHILPFNYGYQVTTEAVDQGVKEGVFEDNSRLIGMVRKFSRVYHDNLLAYSIDDFDSMTPAWLRLFKGKGAKHAPAGSLFWAGFLAHVAGDLAIVLDRAGVEEDYHPDYTVGVGLMLDRAGQMLAPAMVPGPTVTKPLLTGFGLSKVAKLREGAWQDNIRLGNAGNNLDQRTVIEEQIRAHADRLAKYTLTFGSVALQPLNLVLPTEPIPSYLSAYPHEPPQAQAA